MTSCAPNDFVKTISSFPCDLMESVVNGWCLFDSADSQRRRPKSWASWGGDAKLVCWKTLMRFVLPVETGNGKVAHARKSRFFSQLFSFSSVRSRQVGSLTC